MARPPVHILLEKESSSLRSGATIDSWSRAGPPENPLSASSSSSSPVDDPRVYLAAERTFLAWVRTSIALMGFGFLIARFALLIREYGLAGAQAPGNQGVMSTWLGFGMVCGGVVVCAIAAVRHHA